MLHRNAIKKNPLRLKTSRLEEEYDSLPEDSVRTFGTEFCIAYIKPKILYVALVLLVRVKAFETHNT